MLPLLGTQTEHLECTSKREKERERAGLLSQLRGTPHLTAFTIAFLRVEVPFSCSVCVLRRDSISGHELL